MSRFYASSGSSDVINGINIQRWDITDSYTQQMHYISFAGNGMALCELLNALAKDVEDSKKVTDFLKIGDFTIKEK